MANEQKVQKIYIFLLKKICNWIRYHL